jgi:hypothetical protein
MSQFPEFRFADEVYWESRTRQGNKCASCGEDLQDLPREVAPGHHAGVTQNEARLLGMELAPVWIKSSENCAVVCESCHTQFVHDGGRFRQAVEDSFDYKFVLNSPVASRDIALRQEVARENMHASAHNQNSFNQTSSQEKLAMPEFDNRKRDNTQDNLFSADTGPKAEASGAKSANRGNDGQSETNNGQENLKVPSGFAKSDIQEAIHDAAPQWQPKTTYADWQKTVEPTHTEEALQEQKQDESQTHSQTQRHSP